MQFFICLPLKLQRRSVQVSRQGYEKGHNGHWITGRC